MRSGEMGRRGGGRGEVVGWGGERQWVVDSHSQIKHDKLVDSSD